MLLVLSVGLWVSSGPIAASLAQKSFFVQIEHTGPVLEAFAAISGDASIAARWRRLVLLFADYACKSLILNGF